MMRRLLSLNIAILLLILVCAGCSSQKEQTLTFSGLPDEDETFTYSVISNADQSELGKTTMSIKKSSFNDQPALEFSAVDKLATMEQEANVIVNGSTLQPLTSTVRVATGGNEWNIEGRYDYEANKVFIKAKLPSGEDSAEREFTTPIFDNAQFIQSIRFLPLEKGYEVLVKDMVIANAQLAPCKIVVLGIEEIEFSDDKISCYHVELRFVGAKQEAWYSVDQPILIKYANDATTMLLQAN